MRVRNQSILLSPDAADGGQINQVLQNAAASMPLNGGDKGDDAGAGTGAVDDTGGDAAAAAQATATPATTGLSKDDIIDILKEAGVSQAPAPATQQPPAAAPQLSQEDYNRMFNVWQPDAGLVAQLRDEDPAKAIQAMVALRDGLVRQALTMADFRIRQMVDGMQKDHIAPMQQFMEEAREEKYRNEFFDKHADLRPYEEIADAVSAKLIGNGLKGTKDHVFSEIAKATRAVVKKLLAANGGKEATPPTEGAKRSKMSTLIGGGQSGGKQTSGAGAAKGPPGAEVFD